MLVLFCVCYVWCVICKRSDAYLVAYTYAWQARFPDIIESLSQTSHQASWLETTHRGECLFVSGFAWAARLGLSPLPFSSWPPSSPLETSLCSANLSKQASAFPACVRTFWFCFAPALATASAIGPQERPNSRRWQQRSVDRPSCRRQGAVSCS